MKRNKLVSMVMVLSLLLGILVGCSDNNSKSKSENKSVEILISAAASMTESLTKIADEYKKVAPNITITYNFASSGALQTQIEEGAPADIFFSASSKQMNALEEKDLIIKSTRKDLLNNEVVLIAPSNSTIEIESFEDCKTDKVSMIAVGDPESVPAGAYAKEVFESLNIWNEINAKANLAANVKEVLAWVETGNVDCGVVYKTDAKVSDKVKIICSAPEGSHKDIVYPVAIIKSSQKEKEAQAFIDYLSTDKAKSIFSDYGFTVCE